MNTDNEYLRLAEHNPQPGDVVEPQDYEGSDLWPLSRYVIQPDGSIIDAEGDAWGGDEPYPYPSSRRFRVVSRAATAEPVEDAMQPPGMTLRDWFAGQALAGHLAAEIPEQRRAVLEDCNGDVDEAMKRLRALSAEIAYEYADAMLEARK